MHPSACGHLADCGRHARCRRSRRRPAKSWRSCAQPICTCRRDWLSERGPPCSWPACRHHRGLRLSWCACCCGEQLPPPPPKIGPAWLQGTSGQRADGRAACGWSAAAGWLGPVSWERPKTGCSACSSKPHALAAVLKVTLVLDFLVQIQGLLGRVGGNYFVLAALPVSRV